MIGLILLITVVMFALLTLLFKKGMDKVGSVLGKTVFARHKAAEYVMDNHKVPPQWLEEWQKRKRGSLLRTNVQLSDEELIRKFALKKLGDLIKYFQRAPVFENDHVRRTLLDDLYNVRGEWLNSQWQEMAPQEKSEESEG